nr:hypothetical protein [Pedobacter sp. ASV19]
MDKKKYHYPALATAAQEISAYIHGVENIYILSLKNGRTERFVANDPQAFREWLEFHRIREVNSKKQL